MQLVCIAPFSILRWVLTGVGFAVSGYFLCANVYPILQTVNIPRIVSFPDGVPLIVSLGGLACEQNIHCPDRPLPRSRRLHLQSDVLQLLRREGRHAGSRTCRDSRGHGFTRSIVRSHLQWVTSAGFMSLQLQTHQFFNAYRQAIERQA